MNKTILALVATSMVFSGISLQAQQKRNSPHETTGAVIEGNRITLIYGRPYTKKPGTTEARKVWGGLVPYGKVWRTGADEATLLTLQKPIVIGETTIPAGAYSLWTLPKEDGTAKLIINKQVGQWGVGPGSYDEKQDVMRADLKKEAMATPNDQFTMAVVKNPAGGGMIQMMWDDTQYSVPFTVVK